MSRVNSTRAITEGAMLVGITVVMAFVNRYLPIFSLFLAIPIALLVVRQGLRFGVLAACVVTLMLFGFMGVAALVAAADIVVAGLSLGFAHERFPNKPALAFMVTSIGYVVSFVLIVYAAASILGVTEATPAHLIDRFLEMYEGVSDQMTDLGAPTAAVDTEMIRPYLMMSIPAFVGLSAAMNAGIVFWIFRRLLSRFGHQVAKIPPFRRWHLSWNYGWGFVLGFLLMTVGPLIKSEVLLRLGLNLFWVFYSVFMVQGFSVIAHYLARWQTTTGVKVVLIVVAIFTGIAQLAMAAIPWLGVLDAWLDFRKLEVSSDASDPDSRPEG